MNRDFIFRWKSRNCGDWIYRDLIECVESGQSRHDKTLIQSFFNPLVNADMRTFTESTGLRDINGQQIFEGDILMYMGDADSPCYVVEFDDGRFVLMDYKEFQVSKYGSVCKTYFTGWELDSGKYAVIGNVFDNKDMLPNTEYFRRD